MVQDAWWRPPLTQRLGKGIQEIKIKAKNYGYYLNKATGVLLHDQDFHTCLFHVVEFWTIS
jgi:hypothetical protein